MEEKGENDLLDTVNEVHDDMSPEDTNNITTTVDEEDLTTPNPQFQYHLFVHLKGGHNLPAKKQNGTSDPYAKFLMNGKTVHRSKTMHKELNPHWDESFMVSVPDLAANMEIKVKLWGGKFSLSLPCLQVFNHNLVKDDIIGSYPLDLINLSQSKSCDLTVLLEDAVTGRNHHFISISL